MRVRVRVRVKMRARARVKMRARVRAGVRVRVRVEPHLVIAARVLVAEELLRLAAPGGDKQRSVTG